MATRKKSRRNFSANRTSGTPSAGLVASRNQKVESSARTKKILSSIGHKDAKNVKVNPKISVRGSPRAAPTNPFKQTFQATKQGAGIAPNPFKQTFQETKGLGVSQSFPVPTETEDTLSWFARAREINRLARESDESPVTGLPMAGLFGTKGIIPGKQVQTLLTGAPGFIVNTATASKVGSYAGKVAAQYKKPAWVAKMIVGAIILSLGGKVFGEKFIGQEETGQNAGFLKGKAYDFGVHQKDWSYFNQALELENQVYEDKTMWESVKSLIPWGNVGDGVDTYVDMAKSSNVVWEAMGKSMQEAQANEETPEETLARELKTKEESFQRNIDYAQEQALITQQQKTLAITRGQQAQSAKEKKVWEKQTEYWEQRDKDQRRLAEEDMIATAEFWDAYNRRQAVMADNNRPSKLNFGLL